MPLSVGSRLGHYEVSALIGEGGMGQVTDTKLNRHGAADPRRRIAPGPIPLDEALPPGKQSLAQAPGS